MKKSACELIRLKKSGADQANKELEQVDRRHGPATWPGELLTYTLYAL